VVLRRIRLGLVILTLVVLQTTVFTHLRVVDAGPDLCLVGTIAMAYEEGAIPGAIFGFVSGLAIDLFLSTPFGLSALAYALTGYGVGIFQSGLIRETRGITVVLAGIGSLIGNLIFLIVGGLAGHDELFALHNIQILIVASLYDALLAIPVFPFVRWAAKADSSQAWPPR